MSRSITLLFVAVLVVSSAGLATADTLGNPVISVHLPDNRVDADTDATLDLFVLNGGELHLGGAPDAEARVTTARQVLVALNAGNAPLVVETEPRPVGNVPEGVVGPVTFAVSVEENAPPGTYELPVRVTYVYTHRIDTDDPDEPEYFQRSETLRTSVEVVVEGQADFDVSDVRSTLTVGDEGTINGTVTNTGREAASNAVVVLTSENPNIVPVETEFAVGDLARGESASFAFDAEVVESAAAGPRQLTFDVRYRDTDDEVRRVGPLDARVDVGPEGDVFSTEPLTQSVTAGEAGVLELRLTNAGDEPVSDVSAKLFTDAPLSSSDDEAFVDRLEPGESTTLQFALSAAPDALEKVYPVSLDYQYTDADGDTKLSDTYDVAVEVTRPEDDGGLSVADVVQEQTVPLIGGAVIVAGALLGLGIWIGRRR